MSIKMRLRRFVLGAAATYKGRSGDGDFTRDLLACFGPDGKAVAGPELGHAFSVVKHGKRTSRNVSAFWPERGVLIDVVKQDAMLDWAWKDLLHTCLQADPVPQYVVLSNQRDVHLYDLARDREEPRLSIALDELPKYSEAFPFLTDDWVPGTTPQIINVARVSGEVAELVAKLYRSLKKKHKKRADDVIRFTLQCIVAMFAEDIGLLPQEYFTTLLYAGAESGNVEKRLRELFGAMSKRGKGKREIPLFNGGLFTDPVTLPLGKVQLVALTKAAEANWTYVDPHIFGSVFQGIMDDDERHASGAHYTAREDIMRVVGPTIVERNRSRVGAAGDGSAKARA